jgi:hypothetical protein
MKILDYFLFLWVIFALLDPDPATHINADPETDPDPDPKPCSPGITHHPGIPLQVNTIRAFLSRYKTPPRHPSPGIKHHPGIPLQI